MLRFLEDYLCLALDRDSAWLGVRRLKPAADQPYTSSTLLVVCLLYGVPLAAITYALIWLLGRAMAPLHPLSDDSAWLPRLAAWLNFVILIASQSVCM